MVDARAVLIDIDGVLTVSWEPLAGAIDALRAIRDVGLPFRVDHQHHLANQGPYRRHAGRLGLPRRG